MLKKLHMSEKSSTFAIEKEVENQQVRCSTWNKKSKKKRNKNGRANREKQAHKAMNQDVNPIYNQEYESDFLDALDAALENLGAS